MNVLAVVAHPDDEIMGCGATLLRLRRDGHRIFSCVLCAAADARVDRPDDLERYAAEAATMIGIEDTMPFFFRNIQFNAVPHIEMVQAVEKAIDRFRPEWIFTLHPRDLNIDHRVCYETTMAASMLPQRMTRDMPATMIKKIFLCEILSSTDWASPVDPPFLPNAFVDVAATLEEKIAALEHFRGAMKPPPHSRSLENMRRLAQMRGAQIGIEAAEAFVVVRDLI